MVVAGRRLRGAVVVGTLVVDLGRGGAVRLVLGRCGRGGPVAVGAEVRREPGGGDVGELLLLEAAVEDGLDGAELLDELERGLGADAADGARVVAAAEDTEVDELGGGEAEAGEDGRVRDLGDLVVLALFREGHVPELLGRPEGERVHVLGRDGMRLAAAHELGALRLGLARRVDDRHAHRAEQVLDVVAVLAAHLGQQRAVLADGLDVVRLLRLLQLRLGLLALRRPLRQLTTLHARRLAVEDVDRLDARLQQPDRPVEHALDVRRLLPLAVRQDARRTAIAVAPDRDQELVQRHRRIDRHHAARVRLDHALLHRARRVLVNHAHEPLDAHLPESLV